MRAIFFILMNLTVCLLMATLGGKSWLFIVFQAGIGTMIGFGLTCGLLSGIVGMIIGRWSI